MASQQKIVDFVVEQMGGGGRVTSKKMFGEYCLYLDGRMFALVCDDQLFMKPTPAGRAYAPDLTEGIPYPGAKPCLLVTGDRWDDADWLAELARVTAAGVPLPKLMKPKSR